MPVLTYQLDPGPKSGDAKTLGFMQMGEGGAAPFTINRSLAGVVDHFGAFPPDTLGRPGTTVEGSIAIAPAGQIVVVNMYVNGPNVDLNFETRAIGDNSSPWRNAGYIEVPDGSLSGLRFHCFLGCQWRPVLYFRDAVRSVELVSRLYQS